MKNYTLNTNYYVTLIYLKPFIVSINPVTVKREVGD